MSTNCINCVVNCRTGPDLLCDACRPPSPPFIVAEISKTWSNGEAIAAGLLAQRFETVIAVNLTRGYELVSFNLAQCWVPERVQLVETIIAVFRRKDGGA